MNDDFFTVQMGEQMFTSILQSYSFVGFES